ncbi:BA75_03515T1 [Komagataella pastoris]|uniref:BA75_03515T1 n=1 Tax=Komagataella pastoris TaxID=4922 RepID=A0A1B2JEK1_PICPA|nr:BA75_03515T1 [Komagataella pastoris]
MQYSDDDLNDYENEPYDDDEFIEEDLTKEELDELYTLLPLIKAKLKDHNPNITDRDFKEALWFNYMVVDDAVKELKQNFKKVKANFSKPNPVDVLANEPKSAVTKKSEASEASKESEKPETVQEKLQKLTIKHTKPLKSLDINAAINKRESQNISFVVFGHVDSGKSTIIGRLLYDLKVVDSKTLHKLTKESSSIGKGSFALAWIMDQTSEERERGVTIDICQTSFNYKNKQFTIIDSPGHQDFIPQMINGVCQADIAVLIVDSSDFAKTFNHGQTKEQLRIAKSLNLNKLIVVVNKMDLCDWNIDQYDKIVEAMQSYLFEDLQYRHEDCQFIPASGLNGDNVVKGRGNSVPLVDLLYHENKVKELRPIAEQKLIMTIIDVEDQAHDNLTLKVRVNSGFVQAGETVKLLPSFDFCRINKILKSNEPQDICIAGEFVVLKMKVVKSIEEKSLIRLGDLCVSIDDEVPISSNLRIEIHLFDMDKPLLKGTPFVLFRNNVSVPARITEIEQIMNSQKKKVPRHLSSRQRAIVSVTIENKLPIITWEEKVRRIVIRKDSSIIGAGQIIEAL